MPREDSYGATSQELLEAKGEPGTEGAWPLGLDRELPASRTM